MLSIIQIATAGLRRGSNYCPDENLVFVMPSLSSLGRKLLPCGRVRLSSKIMQFYSFRYKVAVRIKRHHMPTVFQSAYVREVFHKDDDTY